MKHEALEANRIDAVNGAKVAIHRAFLALGISRSDYNRTVLKWVAEMTDDASGAQKRFLDSIQNCNEQGHVHIAEEPGTGCPAQPNGGSGQAMRANGQYVFAASAAREPSQAQIDARIKTKQEVANSLFETKWFGKPIGSWTYRELISIRDDASALLAEIGDIAAGMEDREVRELLNGSEFRLRRAMRAFTSRAD